MNYSTKFLVIGLFLVASTLDAQEIDFSQTDGFGIGQSEVQINNIRVDTVIENPFDPSRPEIVSSVFNVPFVFDPTTLHLVPNLNVAVVGGDDGACTSATLNVSNAFTGDPIVGASVATGGQTVVSDSAGTATLLNLSAGPHSVSVASQQFDFLEQTITILCEEENSFGLALNPISGSIGGLVTGEFRIVLSWGESPSDLDSHLTGPDSSGGDSRFHVFFAEPGTDIANLDVDDIDSFGPETITVSPEGGSSILRPGLYRYSVHHFFGDRTISTSSATVKLISADGSIDRTFTPPSGATGEDDVWTVFELQVDNSGATTIFPIDTFTNTDAGSVRSVSIPTSTGFGSVENGVDWANLPGK